MTVSKEEFAKFMQQVENKFVEMAPAASIKHMANDANWHALKKGIQLLTKQRQSSRRWNWRQVPSRNLRNKPLPLNTRLIRWRRLEQERE